VKYRLEQGTPPENTTTGSLVFSSVHQGEGENTLVATEHVAKNTSISPNHLENAVCQYLCKFLTLHVDVQSKGTKNRRKKVIHAVAANMKTKLSLFVSNVILQVLQGERFLVDDAMYDRMKIQRFNLRRALPPNTDRRVGLFQLHAYGMKFLTKNSLLHIKHTSDPAVASRVGYCEDIPFMRISIVDNSTEKNVKLTPTWFRGIDFLTHLFDKVRQQTDILQKEINDLRKIFEQFYAQHHIDESSGEVKDANDGVHLFKTGNFLIKKNLEDDSYIVNLGTYLLSWDENCMATLEEFKDVKVQPSLSTKLAFLEEAFNELLLRVVMYFKLTKNLLK